MAPTLQFPLNRLKPVELSVHNNPRSPILARDRLVARGEIDDAQARVSKPNSPVLRYPLALPVWATVIKTTRCALKHFGGHTIATRKNGYDSTHDWISFLQVGTKAGRYLQIKIVRGLYPSLIHAHFAVRPRILTSVRIFCIRSAQFYSGFFQSS